MVAGRGSSPNEKLASNIIISLISWPAFSVGPMLRLQFPSDMLDARYRRRLDSGKRPVGSRLS